jgi:hypothetical protein
MGTLPNEYCHDILNLLFIIQGRVEVVLLELDAGDPHRNDILEIHKACLRAVALTETWRAPRAGTQ